MWDMQEWVRLWSACAAASLLTGMDAWLLPSIMMGMSELVCVSTQDHKHIINSCLGHV